MRWTSARASLANAKRHHPAADHSNLERELRVARAEDYIDRLLATAPPLTSIQRDYLAGLLRSPNAGEAA